MAKRPRLTVDDMVQQCFDTSDDDHDYDPDEPVMQDEFSDLERNESDEGDLDTRDNIPPSSGAGASTSSGIQKLTWSTTIQCWSIHPFTSTVGPTQNISSSPLDVFDPIFSPDLMGKIVKESNNYAKSAMSDEKYDKWLEITVDELKAFLGFSVLMGINHLPSLNDYWSRDPRLWYAPVADRITRD